MAGRFARGFQDCRHHPTGGGVYGEGPKNVESHCLSAAGACRPVRCVGVTDALSQSSKSSKSYWENIKLPDLAKAWFITIFDFLSNIFQLFN